MSYNGKIEIKSWQQKLLELEFKWRNYKQTLALTEGLEDVNRIMKQLYPGNYSVIEAYDSKRGVFGFKLVFEDPKEQTMWLLRWS